MRFSILDQKRAALELTYNLWFDIGIQLLFTTFLHFHLMS